MKVVKGPSSAQLAEKVARYMNVEAVDVFAKVFPDGESYVRLSGDVRGEDVIVVQGTHPPQDINFVKLLLLVDAVTRMGAKSVKTVIPYMAYARQDRVFLEGEPVSIQAMLKSLRAVGADEAITVNIHSPWTADQSAVKLTNIDASGLLASYIIQAGVEKPLIVSPGKKGSEMAAAVASVIETDYMAVKTMRSPETGEVEVKVEEIEKGRQVVVVDDIISTGTTMAKTIQQLKNYRPSKIIVAAVHGLFIGSAAEKISSAGADLIITTDTVPNPYGYASVAGLIASHLS